jgi:hypothetical protein
MRSRFHIHIWVGEDPCIVKGTYEVDTRQPFDLLITHISYESGAVDVTTYPLTNKVAWQRLWREVAIKLGRREETTNRVSRYGQPATIGAPAPSSLE